MTQETKNKFYVVLYDEATNEARACQNVPKYREKIKEYATETSKAYRVKADSVENAVEVFRAETGIECEFVKIVYKKNIPTVKEIEL